MGSPSQTAQRQFRSARNGSDGAVAASIAASDMAGGLTDAAIALRAIYQKLEEVETQIRRLKRARA